MFKYDRSDMSATEAAYQTLYENPRDTLSDKKVAAACEELFSFSYSSLMSERTYIERVERMLEHDNIPEKVYEKIMNETDLSALVDPFSGLAHKLLWSSHLTESRFMNLIRECEKSPEAQDHLLISANQVLQQVGMALTYEVVSFRKPRKKTALFTVPVVTQKEHQKDQQRYRVLARGVNKLEWAIHNRKTQPTGFNNPTWE
jgi:hypothetical protein